MCEPATLDRLVETAKYLPDECVAEICNFAEFIQSRRGYDETAYLLSNPVNAERLRHAVAELDGGGGQVWELMEC